MMIEGGISIRLLFPRSWMESPGVNLSDIAAMGKTSLGDGFAGAETELKVTFVEEIYAGIANWRHILA